MTLSYPTTHKKFFAPKLSHRPKNKPIISSLHQDENIAKLYSEQLDSKLDPDSIPSDLDALCDRITTSIHDSIEATCPKSVHVKSAPPWENAELQDLMARLRKDPNNVAKTSERKEKRISFTVKKLQRLTTLLKLGKWKKNLTLPKTMLCIKNLCQC